MFWHLDVGYLASWGSCRRDTLRMDNSTGFSHNYKQEVVFVTVAGAFQRFRDDLVLVPFVLSRMERCGYTCPVGMSSFLYGTRDCDTEMT